MNAYYKGVASCSFEGSCAGGRLRRFAVCLILILLVVCATHVRAESLASSAEVAETTHWYGYQLIIGDLAALALFGAALHAINNPDVCFDCGTRSDIPLIDVLMLSALSLYGLAAPTVHAAHGHWDKAALSFAMRVAPAAIGLAIGDRGEGIGAGVVLFGSLFGMLVDWAIVANEQAPPAPHADSAWSFGLASRGRTLNATLRFP